MSILKQVLMEHCRRVLEDRAARAQEAIAAARAAAANETKSSAGDILRKG